LCEKEYSGAYLKKDKYRNDEREKPSLTASRAIHKAKNNDQSRVLAKLIKFLPRRCITNLVGNIVSKEFLE